MKPNKNKKCLTTQPTEGMSYDLGIIPDRKNLNTCLNCTEKTCKGVCGKITGSK